LFLAEDANGVVPLFSLDTLRQSVGSSAPIPGGDR